MLDDPQSFRSENLPKYRWATFFKELFEIYKDQPVNILADSDFLHIEPPQDKAPLTALQYDSHHGGLLKHRAQLVISTGGPEGETVTVDVPTIVWVYRELDGGPIGLEVIDQENNRVVIRFA